MQKWMKRKRSKQSKTVVFRDKNMSDFRPLSLNASIEKGPSTSGFSEKNILQRGPHQCRFNISKLLSNETESEGNTQQDDSEKIWSLFINMNEVYRKCQKI